MNGQNQEYQIKLLRTQIKECRKKIHLIEIENEKHLHMIQSLAKHLDTEGNKNVDMSHKDYLTVQNFNKVIDELKGQMEEIQSKQATHVKSIGSVDSIPESRDLSSELSDQNDIDELKKMVTEIYQLVHNNQRGSSQPFSQLRQHNDQNSNSTTFRDLQETGKNDGNTNIQYKSDSVTTYSSNIPNQQMPTSVDRARFTSHYSAKMIPKKTEIENQGAKQDKQSTDTKSYKEDMGNQTQGIIKHNPDVISSKVEITNQAQNAIDSAIKNDNDVKDNQKKRNSLSSFFSNRK